MSELTRYKYTDNPEPKMVGDKEGDWCLYFSAQKEIERLKKNLSLAECYISEEYWDNYMSKRK